jgi:hypothetical protein
MAEQREKAGIFDSLLIAFVQSNTLSNTMISEVFVSAAGVLSPFY